MYFSTFSEPKLEKWSLSVLSTWICVLVNRVVRFFYLDFIPFRYSDFLNCIKESRMEKK